MAERDFTRPNQDRNRNTDYTRDIEKAKSARNSQYNDTNPMIEKEGFLGVDDIDKMRRRKLKLW